MNERTVESVTPIDETDWEQRSCMDSDPEMDEPCSEMADFVLALEYEDEPGKTFYSRLCKSCAAEYTKKHDAATVMG